MHIYINNIYVLYYIQWSPLQHISPGFGIWDRTRTPLDTPKTLETCKKIARLVWLKKLQGVRKIARLKQQRFLSFTFYKTHRSYEKSCAFICYFIGSVVKIVLYLHFLYIKDDRLQQIKKNIHDGTIFFLTSLLIVLT